MDPLVLLALGTVTVVGGILALRLHAFLALLGGAAVVAALTPSDLPVGQRLATGFGGACADVGLLIAMASIVGKTLLDSGGADRIVRTVLRWCGEKRAPLAFIVAGFVLGIPVFFDTVLLLLAPLAKAMAVRKPRDYLLYILCIVAGGTMTHSLVPPTPGPMYVAAQLNVDIGVMMLGGIVVGVCASAAGFAYALWINRRMPVPLRATDAASLEQLAAVADADEGRLPPFWLAVLPILLPIVLVSGRAAAVAIIGEKELLGSSWAWLGQLGDKNVALAIGAAAGLVTLVFHKRANRADLAAGMNSALASAGMVILITAAGGAFGDALEQSGVGPRIEELAEQYNIAVLPLAFLVTALIRTAQGSATVAMITAGGILAGFADDPAALGFHPVYLALAIGCGSKPYPWMNDSGFWLIGRIGGLTEAETLKSSSTMIALMGCSGMVVVLILAALFPMVPR